MSTHQIVRRKYIDFFTSSPRNHKEIPSSPLVPENDPTVLFITAGMHPLVPYLLGEIHPLGKRLVDVQKSFRTDDIEEVGDERHFTFFEMLGNWSLGDYFKKEAINYSFEFLTGKKWLNLDPNRIYISVFEGDQDALIDNDSIKYWQHEFSKAGISANVGSSKNGVKGNDRIFPYPKSKNWWGPAGNTGPCGPDTEMFYDTQLPLHNIKKHGPVCHINCDCGRYVEIWNDVFMEYNKMSNGKYESLSQKNVDTGMGMERVVAIIEWIDNKITDPDPFRTSLFVSNIEIIKQLSGKEYENEFKKSIRIISDHIRASSFLIADGVIPSNKERGYVLRKLIRRSIRHANMLGIKDDFVTILANDIIKNYQESYPELSENKEAIFSELAKEEKKFKVTLVKGLNIIEKQKNLNGKIAFDLYQTYGFPLELTIEIAQEKGQKIDVKLFNNEFLKHQQLSRTATKGVFKGGLQDHSDETTKLHTATHLLQQALRNILGNHVRQKGSHITSERLRFDFTHSKKISDKEIIDIENTINKIIKNNLKVEHQMMHFKKAIEIGALFIPNANYPETVKVYSVGNFSKEICGGPHVDFTGSMGSFKIIKEENLGSGIRRIYAKLNTP
jgi:alanyl-tRNA synthetase